MEEVWTTPSHQLNTRSLVLHDSIVIDRSETVVWPALFQYNKWNPAHIGARTKRVAGAENEVGEIIIEWKINEGIYLSPIAIEIVKIVPFKKLVWKLYDLGEAPEFDGFVDFSLRSAGSSTTLIYNSYSELPVGKFNDLPSEAAFTVILKETFTALKRFVEEGGAPER